MDDLTVDADAVVREYQTLLAEAQYQIIVMSQAMARLREENRDLKELLTGNKPA